MKSQIDAVLESEEKCRRHRDNWKARALTFEMDNKNLKSDCSMQRDEIDRYKAECDMLRGIIEGLECQYPNICPHSHNKCSNCNAKQEAKG